MVSSGTVTGDLGNIENAFNSYNSAISGVESTWKGPSADSFKSKANDFASSYLSTISSGMNAFAAACSAYESYKAAEANYNTALSNASSDPEHASQYQADASKFKAEMDKYATEINNNLATAKGAVLEANATSVQNLTTGTTTGSGSANSVIQSAMDWAIAIAADDSHGYSQSTRYGNPNYDCSSLVISAYEAAGIPVQEAGAGYTGNMRSAFTQVGFQWIPGNPNMADLQPGDVLLRENDHTEMYVGNGMNVGAHSNYDGRDGDSSGREVNVQEYHGSWDGVLRYTGNNPVTT